MYSKNSVLAAAMAGAVTSVSAHGYVSDIIIDGESHVGYNPTNAPWEPQQDSIGWENWATDTGFVPSTDLQDDNIICHIDGKNPPKSASVAAGTEITLQWTEWPRSHHGPVIDYLAKCEGDCETVDKTSLRFFKIAELGQLELGAGAGETGYWASDKFIDDGSLWKVTIPESIAPGNYVLRHEQIALHEGLEHGRTQMYPQCINLEITGGGSDNPEGVLGTELYSAEEPGILYNIYNDESNPVYTIPGPDVYEG